MRKRARTDLCGGRSAMVVPTASGLILLVAGVVHSYWLVKSDIRLPLLYGAIVTVLLWLTR